jgi:hypothetical protein
MRHVMKSHPEPLYEPCPIDDLFAGGGVVQLEEVANSHRPRLWFSGYGHRTRNYTTVPPRFCEFPTRHCWGFFGMSTSCGGAQSQ